DENYLVMDEVDDLKTIWELKSFLPIASKSQIKKLRKDIRSNGIIDPILYWVTPEGDKLVIEGHTRIEALGSLKKVIPQKKINADFENLEDIRFWMLSHQLNRRNLSNVEKLQLAFRYKDEIESKARKNQSKGGKGEDVTVTVDTYAEIAKLADVGRATATRYGSVISGASQKVIKDLHNSQISINAAAKTVGDAKPDRKVVIPTSTVIVDYNDLNDAQTALGSGDIDAVVLLPSGDTSPESVIKKVSKKRVGVVRG
ncbi:ParB N-terminal domain-containing protein, partial [Bacteroidota bacterium]